MNALGGGPSPCPVPKGLEELTVWLAAAHRAAAWQSLPSPPRTDPSVHHSSPEPL